MAAFRKTYKMQNFLNTYLNASIIQTQLIIIWKFHTQKKKKIGLESVKIFHIFKETTNNNSPNKQQLSQQTTTLPTSNNWCI